MDQQTIFWHVGRATECHQPMSPSQVRNKLMAFIPQRVLNCSSKPIVDSQASETIIGVNTFQEPYDMHETLVFDPRQEI